MKTLIKRGLAVLLALVMCLGMLNLTAFADEGDGVCACEECAEECVCTVDDLCGCEDCTV